MTDSKTIVIEISMISKVWPQLCDIKCLKDLLSKLEHFACDLIISGYLDCSAGPGLEKLDLYKEIGTLFCPLLLILASISLIKINGRYYFFCFVIVLS